MNYPTTDDDRNVLERARTLVEALIPYEVEAEMNDGEVPPDVKKRHHELVRELGPIDRRHQPLERGCIGILRP